MAGGGEHRTLSQDRRTPDCDCRDRHLERYRPTDAARQDYLASFEGERFAESMRYVRTYPEQLPVLRDLLPTIETPVLIINGARDPVVPPVNAEYLHERLPKSKLEVIDAGHFIWEDAADTYAALVTSWWAAGYTKVDSGSPATSTATG